MARLTSEDVPRVDGMPTLGLGTWQNDDPQECADSVRAALNMGYRHVDTAQAYGNEEAVGDGLAASSIDREDVFLATKVSSRNLAHDDVIESVHASLDRLGVESVDLLYVHWPTRTYDPESTLPAFEELKRQGLIDRIGVSNFHARHLETAQRVLDEPIFANQIELHPLLPQERLREVCEAAAINVVGYSPLARGKVFDVPEISRVADKHDTSEAQVALAWARRKGVTPIPKGTSEAHIRDNWQSVGLELDREDVRTIDNVDERARQIDPDWAPW